MEWEKGDYSKFERRYNFKWNFLLNLVTVYCFSLCIVYVKLELNKLIYDLFYLLNGLNIYFFCFKGLLF